MVWIHSNLKCIRHAKIRQSQYSFLLFYILQNVIKTPAPTDAASVHDAASGGAQSARGGEQSARGGAQSARGGAQSARGGAPAYIEAERARPPPASHSSAGAARGGPFVEL
jgi:hypothetical protein